MKSIKTKDCDIVIEDGQMSYVYDNDRLSQNQYHRLCINQGEWFIDLELGLDYSQIQGKGVTDAQIAQALYECSIQDDEVSHIEVTEIVRNRDRSVEIEYKIYKKEDEPTYMRGVLDIA